MSEKKVSSGYEFEFEQKKIIKSMPIVSVFVETPINLLHFFVSFFHCCQWRSGERHHLQDSPEMLSQFEQIT